MTEAMIENMSGAYLDHDRTITEPRLMLMNDRIKLVEHCCLVCGLARLPRHKVDNKVVKYCVL